MKRLLVIASYPYTVRPFRGDLIESAIARGVNCTVLSADCDQATQESIESLGATFESFPIQRNSLSVRSDLRTLSALKKAIRRIKPDFILAYTIKPVIWGGIASKQVPAAKFVALVTGLGYTFQGTSLKRRLLTTISSRLYRYALRSASAVVFQNRDNLNEFTERGIIRANQGHVVGGSGINIERFPMQPIPNGKPRFLLIARLLGEKGIREYAEAAKSLASKFPDAEFQLLGPPDPSPDGIALAEVRRWHEAGHINYLGETSDVRPFLRDCNIFCLPSYHEGMPRSVLEAMASGRPILTTDTCGCRDTVQPGRNGWLVPPADSGALAERMQWFIQNATAWQEMGRASRSIAEERFDVVRVNRQMLSIMGIAQNV